jgi:hypothetical protein
MKNKIIIFLIILIVIGLGFWGLKTKSPATLKNTKTLVVSPTPVKVKPVVTLVFNDNQVISTYSAVNADNAFEALLHVVAEKQFEIEIKKYDFGVFIAKLDGKASDANMSWIFFINGKSGSVAADKAILKTGDVVEWKYVKPQF